MVREKTNPSNPSQTCASRDLRDSTWIQLGWILTRKLGKTERRIVHVHTSQPPEVRPQILRFCVQAEVLSEWWHACPGPYRPVKCPSNPRFPVECPIARWVSRILSICAVHLAHGLLSPREERYHQNATWWPWDTLGCANLLWLGAD